MQISDIVTLTNHKGLVHGFAKLRNRGLRDVVLYCRSESCRLQGTEGIRLNQYHSCKVHIYLFIKRMQTKQPTKNKLLNYWQLKKGMRADHGRGAI